MSVRRRTYRAISRLAVAVVIAAMLMPLALMLGIGAVEISLTYSDRARTQDVADAAALMGARQLGLSPVGAAQHAEVYAQAQLASLAARDTVSVSAASPSSDALTVTITTHRPSFFGSLLPYGGFSTSVSSTAAGENALPLCVLVFGDKGGDNLHLQNTSVMQAPACLVQSNASIMVDPGASLQAGDAQSSGPSNGSITPTPATGAAPIADPFASTDIAFPSGCSTAATPPGPGGPPGSGAASTLTIDGSRLYGQPYNLPPGLYCQNIDIKNGAMVTLSDGEYYLAGNFVVEDTSRVTGTDVVLQFNTNASFDFMGSSQISLKGRQSGKYAGFVIMTTRTNQASFTIESDHVTNLEGVIYVPNAQLQVYGTSPVAEQSAWTVITALSLMLRAAPPLPPIPPLPGSPPIQPMVPGPLSSPELVINANYSSSYVPVPTGVGDSVQSAKLVK